MRITAELVECVRRRMEELDFSTYDVVRESGGSISNGSVHNIYSQKVTDIKEKTFDALAKGLKMSSWELKRCMGDKVNYAFTHAEVAEILNESNELSDSDIKEMEHIWNMLLTEIRRRKSAK